MGDNYDKFTVVNYVKTVSCLRVYHTQFQFQSPLTLKIVFYDREKKLETEKQFTRGGVAIDYEK